VITLDLHLLIFIAGMCFCGGGIIGMIAMIITSDGLM
jgi:hypothetical protein